MNSHTEFTNEFIVELEDGSKGVGALPRGETISIYKDKVHARDGEAVINKIYSDGAIIKRYHWKHWILI